MHNVTLIGMPGSGKSALGRAAATQLHMQFIDTDDLLVRSHGPLHEILQGSGSEKFGEYEEEAVLSLGDVTNTIIATGGSVVYSEHSMLFLRKISRVLFLDAPLEALKARVEHRKQNVMNLKEKGWDALYAERIVLYRKYADVVVELPDAPVIENAARVLPFIEEAAGLLLHS